MNLSELLEGSESVVEEWLREKNLVHQCDCGYTVYDVDAVNSALQEEWGDERCDEVYQWACDLANRFGWLWIESSKPKHDIYHCQHCAESEFSFLMDLEKISRSTTKVADAPSNDDVVTDASPEQTWVVYIDESYTNEFPRIPDGSLSFGALIIPESAVKTVEQGVADIISANYRGSKPDELKYSAISKHAGLLERVGRSVADLINGIRSSAVIAIYVPRSGLFGEESRTLRAIGHYTRTPPTPEELRAVESNEAVEAAVRESANKIAQTIATCVGHYLGSRNLSGRIIFDPRNKRLDEPLLKALQEILPKTPIDGLLLPHQDAVVTLPPGPDMQVLGNRVTVEIDKNSRQTPGLQIADFLAGDIRTFFEEVPELLTEATADEPLVNNRILFPQLFRRSELSLGTTEKLKRKGKSALTLYQQRLANGMVSCYARNGQIRNVNLDSGAVFDVMD